MEDTSVYSYCRTCAQTSKDMIAIFGEEGEDRQLADKINNCLPILVVQDDWLPLQICLRCVLWLETAHQLRSTCVSADEKLRNRFIEPPNFDTGTPDTPDFDYPSAPASPASPATPEVPEAPVAPAVPIEEEPSGALQFLAAELGVEDPKTLLIVEKQPTVPDALRIKMNNYKDAEMPPFHCDECQTNYMTTRMFRNHCLSVHDRELFFCTLCFVWFSLYQGLREHIEEIHPTFSLSSIQDNKPLVPCENSRKRRRIYVKTDRICSRCGKKYPYTDIEEFKNHLKEHRVADKAEKLKTSTITCDYCDAAFLTEVSKRSHMLLKHLEYRPHECETCGKKFHSSHYLKIHVTLHSNERSFLCNICGKCFASKSHLRGHMKCHAGRIQCMVCDKFVRQSCKFQHLRKHMNKRIFQCMECGSSFFDPETLKNHATTHFTQVFQCGICGFCFSSEHSLHVHEGYHKDNVTEKYRCPIKACHVQFPTLAEATHHVRLHSKAERFTMVRVHEGEKKCNLYCWSCESSFRHMTMYLNHMRSHHSEADDQLVLTCTYCKHMTHSEEALTTHLESHAQAFDFPCRHCMKNFVTDKQREIHEGIVHGGKVQCESCPRIFIDRLKLRDHMNSQHTGHRPYKCTYCSKGFYNRKILMSHITIHTGERKFVCHICNRAFRIRPDFNKHVASHSNGNMYKCNECSFSSNRKKDVDIHIAADHAEICDADSD